VQIIIHCFAKLRKKHEKGVIVPIIFVILLSKMAKTLRLDKKMDKFLCFALDFS
jgi:hypothetical protein